MEKNFFSIIVPAYQVELYLELCIESIVEQGYSSYEIIIVDDGSTDKTPIICDRLAENNSRIKVIHQENRGLSGARNTGIRHATGQYLLFVDSDDFLRKDALSSLRQAVLKYDFPSVVVNKWELYQNDKLLKREKEELFDENKYQYMTVSQIYQDIQKISRGEIGAWAFCVNREYFLEKKLFFYESILHEDEEWIPKMFMNAKRIGINNKPYYCYRIEREGAITNTLNIKKELDKLIIIELLNKEFTLERYTEEKIRAVLLHRQAILFGVICRLYSYKKNKDYPLLINNINSHIMILKRNSRFIHRFCFYTAKIIGVENTSILLKNMIHLRSLKR